MAGEVLRRLHRPELEPGNVDLNRET
ncbi:hypothetical protein E2C01_082201 [Portunus trituberculatus]|uniref:Uncharacterized protein n=1 Tax=Portunus trituberculatus TaxID=210409 RepID=A0A5B7IPA6_PORTR|nr:hypothetical protein [Portunus trituberculatus]